MEIIKKIRMSFFPLLEGEKITDFEKLEKNDIKGSKGYLNEILDYAIKYYQSENERLKTVEHKASLFINTMTIVSTIIVAITSIIVGKNEFSFSIFCLIGILSLLVFYICRAVWFSIKTLERKKYNVITIETFFIDKDNAESIKDLIVNITNLTRKNSLSINEKVDYMTLAQEYFKRAIITIFIYSLVLLFSFIVKTTDIFSFIEKGIFLLNSIHFSSWLLIILFIIAISALILGIINSINQKK